MPHLPQQPVNTDWDTMLDSATFTKLDVGLFLPACIYELSRLVLHMAKHVLW